MRILIADDSAICRSNLKLLFAGLEDIELSEASNGVEMLELQRSLKPDLIFMDITIPLLDGLSALKILNLIDPSVNIVIITSLAEQRFIISDCLQHGALAVLGKPVTRADALAALGKLKDKTTTAGGS